MDQTKGANEYSASETGSIDSSDSNYLLELADETEYEGILPKDNFHSPYYVSVPTPKQSALGGSAVGGLGSTGTGSSVGQGSGVGTGAANPESLDLYDDGTASFVREYPTDILADRFHKWRKILKSLIIYLREVAYSQEQYARINYSLKNAVKFSFLTDLDENSNRIFDPLTKNLPQKKPQPVAAKKSPFQEKQDPFNNIPAYTSNESSIEINQELMLEPDEGCSGSGFMNFGSGSIQDLQVILKKYHLSLSSQQIKSSKEITQQIIPKLEDLRKDLSHKIKEIKELNADFKTNIQEHVALTGQLLHKYIASVNFLNNNSNTSDFIKLKKNHMLKSKHDPYLLKLQLDLQLKRQLLEENYLQEAYINLQTSGMELEKIIFSSIQKTLQKFSTIIDNQARLVINNLCRELQRGILSKPPCVEWDSFVTRHPRCILNWKSTEPIPQPRKLSDIRYPKMKSSMAKCIRAGYLLKKSKYLKQYNKGYFVLTSNYLHEFKSSNFFKLTKDTGENSEHAIIPSSGNKGRSIVPLMSISLNDSDLIEGEDKFTINCKATYILDDEHDRLVNDSKKSSKSAPSLSKLFKPAGSKNNKSGMVLSPTNSNNAVLFSEQNIKSSSITFKKPSDVDPKEFKKWINNLRELTSFNSTSDRAKYIEEKILKAHNKFANSSLSLAGSKSAQSSSVNLSTQSSSTAAVQRPHYIQIAPSSMNLNLRSKVNTPAIDDNGNLIFASDRPKSLLNHPNPVNSPQVLSPSSTFPNDAGQTSRSHTGFVITSNGITPVQQVETAVQESGSKSSSRDASTNQILNIDGKEFIFATTPTPMSGHVTSTSNTSSGGSTGGYFAIPVGSTSQQSTPTGVTDHTRSSSGEIPRIHINELEAPTPINLGAVNYSLEASSNRNGPYNNLKKNSSANSIPSMSSLRAASPVLLNAMNNMSSPSLHTTGTKHAQGQTQPVRRHKKAVSFNSLNSLMFSKKGANQTNSSYLSDAKINEDDDSSTIDIHKSLYS